MDKFLVDLDSVLDKLEAEDADRCATDKLDEDDEPCNLIGSSVYRNSEIDKIKQSIGGGSGSSSSSSGGISDLHHLNQYKYQQQQQQQEPKIVKSSDNLVTGNSTVIIGNDNYYNDDGGGNDGGSCSNKNSHGKSELDSFLSSKSQPISSGISLTNDTSFGNKNSVKVSQIDKICSEKSSVTELVNYLNDNGKDEPDNISTINDIRGVVIGNINDDNNATKGEIRNCGNIDDNDDKLTKLLDSYHQEDNIMQQSANLDQTYNNIKPSVAVIKDSNEMPERDTVTGYIGLEKNDSVLISTNIKQLESKPIGEKVISSASNFQGSLLSNHSSLPSSSSITTSIVLPKSNKLLENSSKGVPIDSKLKEEEESTTDEEMTEEEVKALEKELESELERLNQQSEVSTLEDIIESETKSTIKKSTEKIVSSSVTLFPPSPSSSSSSKSPSISSTIATPATTISTTTSSSLSPSPSPSPSSSSTTTTLSSSLSTTISKPIETSIASGECLLINQPSESHQSSNETTTNDDETTMINKDELTSTISDYDNNVNGGNTLMVSNKPNRPVTLPLSTNQQSDQPGHTPMHSDGDELIPREPEIDTELVVSSSSQLITVNNQIESDTTVPENVQSSMSSIGYFKPFWIPDEDAPQCMICDVKFTVMKRRHHCRACGKVLCAQCSRFKAPLAYLSYEKARVCDQCLPLLTEGGIISGQDNSFNDSGYYQVGQQQHPLGAEGLPTPSAPPPHQLTGTASSSLVTGSTAQSSASCSSNIQPVSVLRRPSKPRTGEPKQVIFSDGIRPGNDLKDDQVTSISHRRHAKKVKSPPIEKNPSSPGFSSSSSKSRLSKRIVIQDANGQLPPILNAPSLHSDPTFDNLIILLEKEDEPPVTFSLTKNLMALVKLVKLDCCTNEYCWSFTSQNLATVGQDEIIVVVEKISGENVLPRDIFRLFAYIYDSASKGYPFSELSHVLYPDGFFGLKDFPSFVFIRPTFQCLNKLTLPPAPFLIGVLIHRFEVPWAKLFPLRLILRLGSKYHCYPCPIVSYRARRPSYFEIGHTVMDILADFRNFQYTLPVIPGLTIHTEAKRTTVTFPKNRYDKVMKALGSSNEYVLSFGGTFSLTADSHLTCIQNDDGQYHTQTIKLNESETVEPKITGASFIVFSGALKSSTGMAAKMSVVEDGLLVQVTANTLNLLKSSLKDMNDFVIECGKKDAPTNEESVSIIWGEDDKQFNLGVRSCIDGLSLEGINSIRMYSGTDFEGDKYLIRWVELFLIQNTELPRSSDGYDAGRAAEIIAQSFCPALVPCLESLVESKITKIGLRVTLDPDKIGYDIGSNGSPLPSSYINRSDAALIPIIMGNIAPNMEVRLVIELIFYILVK